MRSLLLSLIVICSSNMFGQTSLNKLKPITYDTIVRFGNRKIPVVKLTLGSATVTYALSSKPDSIIRLEKKEIEKIIYKNGNISVLNNQVVEVIKDNQWQAVIVTEDKNQVQGMYKRGSIQLRVSPNTMDKKKIKEGAYIKLQKKAAAIKATIVLIIDDRYDGEYGATRLTYYVEADAYGTEPLETGTDVVDSKDKASKAKDVKPKK